MQVAKWGNSLAVRIPAKMVKELALKEGDSVEMALTPSIAPQELSQEQKRAEALARLSAMPRFLDSDFRFDRDEANERS